MLSNDDRGVQADPVISTHLGVGGSSEDEHVIVKRTAIDESNEIPDGAGNDPSDEPHMLNRSDQETQADPTESTHRAGNRPKPSIWMLRLQL